MVLGDQGRRRQWPGTGGRGRALGSSRGIKSRRPPQQRRGDEATAVNRMKPHDLRMFRFRGCPSLSPSPKQRIGILSCSRLGAAGRRGLERAWSGLGACRPALRDASFSASKVYVAAGLRRKRTVTRMSRTAQPCGTWPHLRAPIYSCALDPTPIGYTCSRGGVRQTGHAANGHLTIGNFMPTFLDT